MRKIKPRRSKIIAIEKARTIPNACLYFNSCISRTLKTGSFCAMPIPNPIKIDMKKKRTDAMRKNNAGLPKVCFVPVFINWYNMRLIEPREAG